MSKARFNTWVVMPASDRSLDDRRRYVRWPARACGTEEYATEEQAIRAARLANAAEGLLEAAAELLAILEPNRRPAFEDPDHQQAVEALGDQIGYGALMSAAEAGWRKKLAAQGMKGGEFVSGPCRSLFDSGYDALHAAIAKAEGTEP